MKLLAIGVSTLVAVAGVSPARAQLTGSSPYVSCSDLAPTVGPLWNAEFRSQVAVDPTNADRIAVSWIQDMLHPMVALSEDGGVTWAFISPPITDCQGGTFADARVAHIAFSSDGVLHLTALANESRYLSQGIPSGYAYDNGIVALTLDESGAAPVWTEPVFVAYTPDARVSAAAHTFLAGANGELFVAWNEMRQPMSEPKAKPTATPGWTFRTDGFGFAEEPFFSRSTDGGATWSAPEQLFHLGANNQNFTSDLALAGDRLALASLFIAAKGTPPPDRGMKGPRAKANRASYSLALTLAWSDDEGSSWSPRAEPLVVETPIFPDYVMLPDAPHVVPGTENDPEPTLVWIEPFDTWQFALRGDEAGNLYLVWLDTRFTGFSAVAFMMSSDGGLTWSTPIRINHPGAASDRAWDLRDQVFLPQVAVGGGTVAVTYYDFRNDDDTGELTDVWMVTCSSSCTETASWSESRLTASSFDILPAVYELPNFLIEWTGLTFDGTDFLVSYGRPDGTDPLSIFLADGP